MNAVASSISESNSFSAHLALAAGVHVSISAPTLADLSQVVGKLQPPEAANDAVAVTPAGQVVGKPKPAAATAPAGKPASQTTEPSAQAAAAQAAQGDAGNATPAGQAADASTASSTKPEGAAAGSLPADPDEAFKVLKKAFLGLSTKADGRAKCEAVNKKFGVAKLSDNKPENYAAVLAAIEEEAAK